MSELPLIADLANAIQATVGTSPGTSAVLIALLFAVAFWTLTD